MIRSSWRIVKSRYAGNAFDGEGAKKTGGRWNAPSTALVYTSGTISLAVLEILANLGSPSALVSFVVIECRFDAKLATVLPVRTLPANWRTFPAPPEVQAVGDRWVRQGYSAVLEVPSVLVPSESNFLLNPAHRDFASIEIGKARPLTLDQRLRQTMR